MKLLHPKLSILTFAGIAAGKRSRGQKEKRNEAKKKGPIYQQSQSFAEVQEGNGEVGGEKKLEGGKRM